jgi:hypothetical protein
METTVVSGNRESKKTVPRRSEKRCLQTRQYNNRVLFGPYWSRTRIFFSPRTPCLGQFLFWQQNLSRSSMIASLKAKSLQKLALTTQKPIMTNPERFVNTNQSQGDFLTFFNFSLRYSLHKENRLFCPVCAIEIIKK